MSQRMSVLRNVAMLSLSSYAELAFGLILGVVIARSLGSAEFGNYAFAVWLCGTLITLSNNAMTMSSIKFIAEARGAGRDDVAAAITARLFRWQIISSTCVTLVFSVVLWVHTPPEWEQSVALMLPLTLLGTWARAGYMMMAAIGKGNERFEVESVSLVLSALANVVLVSILALLGGSLVSFFAVYAVCGLLQNLTARILLRRFGLKPNRATLGTELMLRIKRHMWQTGVLVVVALLGERTIEVLLLKAYTSSEAVGFFAIAGALTKGTTYLLAGALSSVLLPAMSRAFGVGGASSVTGMLREAVRFYWFIGVAIAGLGLTVAPGAVRLFYGAQYEQAIPAVMVNLMVAGFVLILAAFNAFQTSSDHQGDRIRVAAYTLLVNAVLGALLVPKFGLNGALCSFAITRFACVFISWRLASRAEPIRMPWSAMARVLAAAVIADLCAQGVAWLLPGRWSFVLTGAVFFAVFAVQSVWLAAWTQGDFDTVGALLERLGARGRRCAAWLAKVSPGFAAEADTAHTSKRELVARATHAFGVPRLLGAVRSSLVRDFRVLAYHRVLPTLNEAAFDFDVELVSANRREFEWQMAYIARRMRPVSCAEVADALANDRPLPSRAVMVTFDDGFHDNHDVAFPVLRRLGVPATFFLSTRYINTECTFWFDWVVHALLTTPLTQIRLDTLKLTIPLEPQRAARRQEARKLLSALKRGTELHRLAVLEELRAVTGIAMSAEKRLQSGAMSWDHARTMAAAGMEFGSHTVTHPILSKMDDAAKLRAELSDSKATIERETGRPVVALAYPVGGPDALNGSVVQATADAGYEFAFTYQTGANRLNENSRFQLKRLQVERYTSRNMFTAALELPELFAR